MTREWGAVSAAALGGARGGSARERLVDGLVACVAGARSSPMLRRIAELDPEILLPYVVDRRGTSIDRLLDVVVDRITAGQRDASVRAGDPALLARAVLLAIQGFTLSTQTMTDEVDERRLGAELGPLLDRYLCPEGAA
jgi:hypothetical protein